VDCLGRLPGGVGDPVAQPVAHLGDGHVHLVRLIGEGVGNLTAAQAAVQIGGATSAAPNLAAGGTRYRAGRSQQYIAHGDTVAHATRGRDVIGDRPHLQLVRAGGALTDDNQLLGGVVRVAIEPRVRSRLEYLLGELVSRN